MATDSREHRDDELDGPMRRGLLPLLVLFSGLLAIRFGDFWFSVSAIRNGLLRARGMSEVGDLERLLSASGGVTHELMVWSVSFLVLSLLFAIATIADRRSPKMLRIIVLPAWGLFAFLCLRNMT